MTDSPPPPLIPPPVAPRQSASAAVVLRDNWGWFAAAVGTLVVLYFLGPILMPFVVGAALAYLGDPLVDHMERVRIPRTAGVCIVFVVAGGVIALISLLMVPLLRDQVATLLDSIPQWLAWLQNTGLPALGIHLPAGVHLNGEGLRQLVEHNWNSASGVISGLLGRLGRSTPALLATAANLLLIPIVAFYLLRDWDRLVARIADLVPLHMQPRAGALARETDEVLSGLIRGQLLVMASLAIIYSVGLTVIGLNVALLIGIGAGVISFIPYLGFVTGLIAASIAMLVQTHAPLSLVWVGIVFGIGQIMESGVLTPKLVGDRIGLHPVAVIFAILAGGQLFGFVGVLVALPAAAVLAVLLRHACRRWLQSPLYRGDTGGP